MCYKHIPKEYLRRKIIRIFRPNVFGSYLIVFFRLRLASPRSRIESGTSTLDVPENLYRITTVFRIRYCRIHLCLLCFSVFEEVSSNLREQCIGQYILVLQVATEFFKYREAQQTKVDPAAADTKNKAYPV